MKPSPAVSFCRLSLPCLAAFLALTGRTPAQITVTTLTDENDTPAGVQVSLREALRDSPAGGVIQFDAALAGKALVLTSGEMVIAGKSLTVSAPGGLTIEARSLSRIFRVNAGAGLTLTGLTLQGGRAPANGGAILNAGTLSMTDCILRDNGAANGTDGAEGTRGSPPSYFGAADGVFPGGGGQGTDGANGGAVSSAGSLTALRCRFTGNAAGNGGHGGRGGSGGANWPGSSGGRGGQGGAGGAVHSTGALTLTGCIFEANTSGAGGNGGDNGSPPMIGPVSYYVPGGNSGHGGAIFQSWVVTLDSCSLTGNSCPPGGPAYDSASGGYSGSGAALYWSTGTATLTNCTVTGNRTAESYVSAGSTQEHGGAMAAATGGTQLHLVHCTVAQNTSSRARSGFAPASWVTATAAGIVSSAGVPVTCENCILSGNTADRAVAGSPPNWQEVNFSPNTQRTVTPATPLGGAAGENAQLGSLVLSGGPLPVLVPGAASPALDAGLVLTTPPVTDQRGLPRSVGAPDLGAVEIQATESAGLAAQAITFAPPAQVQLTAIPLDVPLSATASSGLPVSFEVISGTATVNGSTLTVTSTGPIAIRALQAGDAATAPAVSVLRVIEVTGIQQTIPFESAASYAYYPGSPLTITLPEVTSAGQTITWSVVGTAPAGITLSGRLVTAGSSGTLQIKGEHPGTGPWAAVSRTWTLTFVPGSVWWETPSYPYGPPIFFSLAEGSTWGLSMTARIPASHTGPVSVPALPAGLIATPSVIPAGNTSVTCEVTLPANPQFVNQRVSVPTTPSGSPSLTLCLANRASVPLQIAAPTPVVAGTSVTVTATFPPVSTPGLAGPPLWGFGYRTLTVSAVDFDNPAVSIPVTLRSQTFPDEWAWFTPKSLQVTFGQINRRAKLTVTTPDGISGSSGPIELTDDTNADGDGVNDLVEAALQRAPNQPHPQPLVFERDAAGLHAVLGSRPLDLQGWSVIIEQSTDLQTWSPAPASSTTQTPNPDGTTERVSVLLPANAKNFFVRLRAFTP